jgi:hypothetical protein
MTTPATGTISVQIPNADGSITDLTASLANCQVTTVPPPVIVPVPPVTGEPIIPATAKTVDMLPLTGWKMNHDDGTGGAASGTTTYPVSAPDGTPGCRQFQMTLEANGGFIYHANALQDATAFNTFCYETEEYYPDASNLARIERDLEQVDATGVYVDMATQLNGTALCLDYTANQSWQHTKVRANPTAIAPGWYKMKRYFKNLGGGMVLYIGSNDNGVYSPLGITVKSQPNKIWGAKLLNVQYQFGGKSSGSVQSTVYARVFRIHCSKS